MQKPYIMKNFFTINNESYSEQTIQKSRFIGYAKNVETEKEAQDFIQIIKKKHYDARHNCYAYIIGEYDEIQKSNDDGEPGGTAGVPILEVIKKRELKNTVIVVARYFGGIKLGVGGLIRAYSSTAAQTLDAAEIIQRKLIQDYEVKIDYTFLGKIQNDINDIGAMIDNIRYEDFVILSILVDVGKEESFKEWIIDLTKNQVEISEKEKKFIDVLL